MMAGEESVGYIDQTVSHETPVSLIPAGRYCSECMFAVFDDVVFLGECRCKTSHRGNRLYTADEILDNPALQCEFREKRGWFPARRTRPCTANS
jgi:hypothetical protein